MSLFTRSCKRLATACASRNAFVIRCFSTKGLPGPLVSPSWLSKNMQNVRILDGSWFPPNVKEDPRANFIEHRIPTSSYFDIDEISDKSNPLPHMLPTPEVFSEKLTALGTNHEDNIVVYDTLGIFSAPRVWWMLVAMGIPLDRVSILSGGLAQWRRDGLPLASGNASYPNPHKAPFKANFKANYVADFNEILETVESPGKTQIVDARSFDRFEGIEPEPREGCRQGHIPGSINIPYSLLRDDYSGAIKTTGLLRSVFLRAELDLSDPDSRIVCTCGSGVTASYLAFGLHSVGHKNFAVYDGSWSEYGSHPTAPAHTGAAKKLSR